MSNIPSSSLQQFLDDEVTAVAREHLLEKALAARLNRVVEPYSGNAYHVAFEEDAVVIEHYYIEGWPAVHLPLQDFIKALESFAGKA
ncbi:hypothetical protein LOY42_16960 [Pseudomonas sp. B21-023]|uniref:hypothetical protein n=1 Tax=unclassified Pseudomonas TaxID=196821 RepID=UPI00111A7CF3|nr:MULTISPECIES: hypothetical protein [unclassified Pseudomonas]MBI6954369.1 hypothetical protein [Pseudomonas sp. CCOS 191]UVL17592.1 hypothetical protein LOY44_16390 [Pseudomonas sp. B21-044]UVM14975.1 hypothetical protein LOY42_16960 [Pseudomonas sp. B21-023]